MEAAHATSRRLQIELDAADSTKNGLRNTIETLQDEAAANASQTARETQAAAHREQELTQQLHRLEAQAVEMRGLSDSVRTENNMLTKKLEEFETSEDRVNVEVNALRDRAGALETELVESNELGMRRAEQIRGMEQEVLGYKVRERCWRRWGYDTFWD